mgnify:CR=1 FL=1
MIAVVIDAIDQLGLSLGWNILDPDNLKKPLRTSCEVPVGAQSAFCDRLMVQRKAGYFDRVMAARIDLACFRKEPRGEDSSSRIKKQVFPGILTRRIHQQGMPISV